jgi:sulfatase maturation enzyme AslB (radical SAM superfamily)
MKQTMKIFIDSTSTNLNFSELWKTCGFIEKLRKLGSEPVIFDPKLRVWPNNLKVVAKFDQLPVEPSDTVIVIEASQLFLDTDIAAAGLTRFRDHGGDYFTQWEHCKLPVGIGVRAYSASLLLASSANSFDDLQEYLFANRESLACLYDESSYVSFEASLLDARLVSTELGGEWNLNSFMAIANKSNRYRYEGDINSLYVDERGMPAAYGFESSECADFPTYVMFDMTNKCNAKCIHCPHSVGFPGSEKSEFIDIGLYKNVIDQCQEEKIDFIRVTADGEPLLHPQIWDLLGYAHERGVGPVSLTSNGSALNAANAQKLLDSQIFMVDFSLDAFSEETFELVRNGLSYQQTHENVLRLIEMRNKSGSDLKIMVSFVDQKENTHELEAFKSYWGPLVDKLLIRQMHTNVGVNESSSDALQNGSKRYPCPHVFRRIVADYAGDLKFCPIDWFGGSKLTRIENESIIDTWHNDAYHQLRLQHLNSQFPSESICKNCEDWKSTPWDLGYEKIVSELAGNISENNGDK